jgi:hypothetical protein
MIFMIMKLYMDEGQSWWVRAGVILAVADVIRLRVKTWLDSSGTVAIPVPLELNALSAKFGEY